MVQVIGLQKRVGLSDVLQYANPHVYLDKEIVIYFPWDRVSNRDAHTITEFVLMAKLADEMGFPIEIID